MHTECRVAAIFRLNVLEFAGRDLDKPDVLERALQLFESLLQRSGIAYRNANQAGGDPAEVRSASLSSLEVLLAEQDISVSK